MFVGLQYTVCDCINLNFTKPVKCKVQKFISIEYLQLLNIYFRVPG